MNLDTRLKCIEIRMALRNIMELKQDLKVDKVDINVTEQGKKVCNEWFEDEESKINKLWIGVCLDLRELEEEEERK